MQTCIMKFLFCHICYSLSCYSKLHNWLLIISILCRQFFVINYLRIAILCRQVVVHLMESKKISLLKWFFFFNLDDINSFCSNLYSFLLKWYKVFLLKFIFGMNRWCKTSQELTKNLTVFWDLHDVHRNLIFLLW